MAKREVKQGPQYQGEDESIAYIITTTNWASSPTSTSAKIFLYDVDAYTYTDQTSTLMTGSTSVNGDAVTLPIISSLVAGNRYRVELQFTVSGNIFEPYFWIYAQR